MLKWECLVKIACITLFLIRYFKKYKNLKFKIYQSQKSGDSWIEATRINSIELIWSVSCPALIRTLKYNIDSLISSKLLICLQIYGTIYLSLIQKLGVKVTSRRAAWAFLTLVYLLKISSFLWSWVKFLIKYSFQNLFHASIYGIGFIYMRKNNPLR